MYLHHFTSVSLAKQGNYFVMATLNPTASVQKDKSKINSATNLSMSESTKIFPIKYNSTPPINTRPHSSIELVLLFYLLHPRQPIWPVEKPHQPSTFIPALPVSKLANLITPDKINKRIRTGLSFRIWNQGHLITLFRRIFRCKILDALRQWTRRCGNMLDDQLLTSRKLNPYPPLEPVVGREQNEKC